jgi:hypothetical protein
MKPKTQVIEKRWLARILQVNKCFQQQVWL